MKFKPTALILLIAAILIQTGCISNGKSSSTRFDKNAHENPDAGDELTVGSGLNGGAELTMKADLLCLMAAYPGYITDIEKEGTEVYAVLKSGEKVLYDDGITKTRDGALSKPDIQDMLEQAYPLGPVVGMPEKDHDPGRIRIFALLEEVYGGSRKKIEQNLISVGFGWKNLSFNNQNEAAANLKRLMTALTKLSKTKTGILNGVFPADGTYNYRIIEGTNRLSPHAFGIAVDLKVNANDYWRWTERDKGAKRLAAYPDEIAEKFEEYGFIWGGKWYHFDIMHYEYRPEFILKARYFTNARGAGSSRSGNGSGSPGNEAGGAEWHEGLTHDLPAALDYANLINSALR